MLYYKCVHVLILRMAEIFILLTFFFSAFNIITTVYVGFGQNVGTHIAVFDEIFFFLQTDRTDPVTYITFGDHCTGYLEKKALEKKALKKNAFYLRKKKYKKIGRINNIPKAVSFERSVDGESALTT